MKPFTKREIENWREFEALRKTGAMNMLSGRDLTEMSREEYVFILTNYTDIKAALEPQSLDGETIQYIGTEDLLHYFNLGDDTFCTKSLDAAEIQQAAKACRERCAK